MGGILVYVLHYEGAFNKNSLGAVSEGAKLAAELGTTCDAVVVGGADLTNELCATLGSYGAAKVFRAEGPEGLAQPVVDVMAKVIDEHGHSYALFGGGLLGFEIGAGLAARKRAGVTMEVTNVVVEGGELVAERPILQDSQISRSKYRGDLGIIIGRINAFEVREGGAGAAEVVDVSVEYSPWSTKATMLQRGEQRGADVNIEDADVLVAGGRGLGKAEGFQLCEDLANALGGAVAATRRARSSTPAGTRTRRRSARPARRSRRSSTSPPASRARSSTRSACRRRRTSWRSTRTRTPRSSSSPTSASSAI
jgi:electron transfer flavoprotein alpha subunit